jgi:hypothetical protein
MEREFKVYQNGASIDDVLLNVKVAGWGQVHTLARLISIVANTLDPVLGYEPPKMTAGVIDAEGNEIVSLRGRNACEVPHDAPAPQSRPPMRV